MAGHASRWANNKISGGSSSGEGDLSLSFRLFADGIGQGENVGKISKAGQAVPPPLTQKAPKTGQRTRQRRANVSMRLFLLVGIARKGFTPAKRQGEQGHDHC